MPSWLETVGAYGEGRRRRRARRPTAPRMPPAFYRAVWALVRRVPRGRVVSYGEVAALLGKPRASRAVGGALAALAPADDERVPWHRVIGAGGRPTHQDDFRAALQRERLEAERIRFDAQGRVDPRQRWHGGRASSTRE